MAIGFTYGTLAQTLTDEVPELRDRYETLRREWDDEAPGPHVVYSDVLNPYLLQLLGSAEATGDRSASLRRIFALLERLARHDDPRVREVVSTTVVERIGDDPTLLAVGRRYMGESTRRLSDETERFWDGDERSHDLDDGVAVVGADRRLEGGAGSG